MTITFQVHVFVVFLTFSFVFLCCKSFETFYLHGLLYWSNSALLEVDGRLDELVKKEINIQKQIQA